MSSNERGTWRIFLMFFVSLFESFLKVRNFSKKIIYYPSVDSTNQEVWNLYNTNHDISNIVIITDNQANGKGRNHNKWHSKSGSDITCSFVLKEVFPKEQFNLHALLIPVAVIKGIKNFLSIDLSIKWPNDIMYENKKIGGILIESKIQKRTILNVGLGINVNQLSSEFPIELENNMISLQEILGRPIQREPLLAYIFNELDILISSLDSSSIISFWMDYCNHKNKEIQFMNNNKLVRGMFKYINDKGQAVVKYNNEYIAYDGAMQIV